MNQLLSSTIKEMIALIATIIGAMAAVYTYFRQRKRISIQLLEIVNADSGFFIQCLISNKSNLPISITQITLQETKQKECSTSFSQPVTIPLSFWSSEVYSTGLPITLTELEAFSGWIGFPILQKSALISPTHLTFQFQTTRGKITIKGLPLSGVPHNRNRT